MSILKDTIVIQTSVLKHHSQSTKVLAISVRIKHAVFLDLVTYNSTPGYLVNNKTVQEKRRIEIKSLRKKKRKMVER